MSKHVIILALVIGVLIAVAAVLLLNSSFLPSLASEQGETIDFSLKLLLAIGAGIFALIVAVLIYSAVVFRQRAGDTADGPPIQSNAFLVAAFFFIPLGLVLWSATFGAVELSEVERGPPSGEDELVVKVTGFQWAWLFEYPELGVESGELVLPVDRSVLFKITSTDVIHSFWVPEFLVKKDAVPGMETELRVLPTRISGYRVKCAELCGLGHTTMVARVKVVAEAEFEQWVEEMRR